MIAEMIFCMVMEYFRSDSSDFKELPALKMKFLRSWPISMMVLSKKGGYGSFYRSGKVFDTVNHGILLDKLHRTGIKGRVYDLFEICLSD